MAQTQIARVSHRHHAIIDWLLVNPHEKNLEVLCDQLNITRSWLSIVMNSDAFREEFSRRRGEFAGELQEDLIREGFETAIAANQKLREYMDAPPDKLDPRILLDAANATADRMFGPKHTSGFQVKETQTDFLIDHGMLVAARQRIREVNSGEAPVLPAPLDTEYSHG